MEMEEGDDEEGVRRGRRVDGGSFDDSDQDNSEDEDEEEEGRRRRGIRVGEPEETKTTRSPNRGCRRRRDRRGGRKAVRKAERWAAAVGARPRPVRCT